MRYLYITCAPPTPLARRAVIIRGLYAATRVRQWRGLLLAPTMPNLRRPCHSHAHYKIALVAKTVQCGLQLGFSAACF